MGDASAGDGAAPRYDDAEYWERRYRDTTDDVYDWYATYEVRDQRAGRCRVRATTDCIGWSGGVMPPRQELKPALRKHVGQRSRVLMVGCGNSALSEDMVRDGYASVTNIDVSERCEQHRTMRMPPPPPQPTLTESIVSAFHGCSVVAAMQARASELGFQDKLTYRTVWSPTHTRPLATRV